MVKLVRQSFLEGSVSLDINDISFLVHLQERREWLDSVPPEVLFEQVAGATPVAFCVSHFDTCKR